MSLQDLFLSASAFSAPVIVNILIFLLTIAPGIGPGRGTAIMALALIYFYRRSFAGVLKLRAQPSD